MKKLTEEEIDARLEGYEEAISHLELCADQAESDAEKFQFRILARQLRKQSQRWHKNMAHSSSG